MAVGSYSRMWGCSLCSIMHTGEEGIAAIRQHLAAASCGPLFWQCPCPCGLPYTYFGNPHIPHPGSLPYTWNEGPRCSHALYLSSPQLNLLEIGNLLHLASSPISRFCCRPLWYLASSCNWSLAYDLWILLIHVMWSWPRPDPCFLSLTKLSIFKIAQVGLLKFGLDYTSN